MPLECTLRLTQRALHIIAECRFPVHLLTKSDLILGDIDLIETIAARANIAGAAADASALGTGSPGAVVSLTITTADDDLACKLEPCAPPPSARFKALETFAKRRTGGAGICTGIMLMPVLPFIEDLVENITSVVTRAHACGATHVVPGFGVTLRDRQRLHYYTRFDRLFPGLRLRYERDFCERYHAAAQNSARLEAAFEELRLRLGLERAVAPYCPPAAGKTPLL